MIMTNYMDLLAANQPWNLILFMVIPVGLAEALVATEFYTVFLKDEADTVWRRWNRRLGIAAGFYFTGVFAYLVTQVLPSIEWRGYADVIAIVAYLSGIVPLLSIALLELGVWGEKFTGRQRTKQHFILLIGFLVVSHVAMIFGMVNPEITGWHPASDQMMRMQAEGHRGISGNANGFCMDNTQEMPMNHSQMRAQD